MRNTDHAASVGLLATGAERGRLRNRSRNRHNVSLAVTVAACLLLPTIASGASPHGKRQLGRAWHGYGFLPGYRPPEQIELDQARFRAPAYWYGGPGFYRGRWNGGGFGPCWTPTPIGPHWNCG
jgi:hypothetical protein